LKLGILLERKKSVVLIFFFTKKCVTIYRITCYR
jgi:hypothetical protein